MVWDGNGTDSSYGGKQKPSPQSLQNGSMNTAPRS